MKLKPATRRRLPTIAAATALAVAATGGIVAYRTWLAPKPDTTVNVIAVQPSPGASSITEADLLAEMAQVQQNGGQLLITAVTNGTAAPALDVNLGCPPQTDPITCQQISSRQTAQAAEVASAIVTEPDPAQVDLYATFADLAGYLSEHPQVPKRKVQVWVNTLGNPDVPQSLVHLEPDQVRRLVTAAVADGSFPGPGRCVGWSVNMVVPTLADPAHQLALQQLFTALLHGCGGVLSRWVPRWLMPSDVVLPLPSIPHVHVGGTPARPTFRLPDTLFAVNSSTVTPAGRTAIGQIAAELLAAPGAHVQCVGHTDGTGSVAYDQALSQMRAAAVCDQLVTDGVARRLLSARGAGKGKSTHADPAERNVEITLVRK